MSNWPPPTLHPAANGVGHGLERDGIELQDLNPDVRVGVPIDVPSEVHPIPAVHPPVLSPPNPPSNQESPPPPSYTTLSDEDQSLKKIIPQRLDGAFVPFLFLMGCCLQLDRLLFFLCQPYFERILGLTEADFKLAAFVKEIAYFAAQVPSNLILSMLDKPATYLCVMLCFWAAVQIRLSYEYTLGHVCACCALLGVFESAFFPGFLHILSC
ncbi:uncharacterized protein F4807DRAFT_358488 [Annulohypoxylon truncatum]|uniref:uncharacterized protein n=1 Tax=Annulohypoxylon truncatum TaxID=327061 RepID=UPI00200810C0|nr:uncharacterized protein F4807DRAFT_358488 [Annulohypoxylon truncatum]KAI1204193.1 hypothetical protein F4807DRAFT_358488 [Annulohypoxylon truncatum]